MEGGHTPDRNPTALKNNFPPPSNRTFPTALKTVLLLDLASLPPPPLPSARSCFLLLVYFEQNDQLVLQDLSRREVGYRDRILGPAERIATMMLMMIMKKKNKKKKGCFYLCGQDVHISSAGFLVSCETHAHSHRRVMIVVIVMCGGCRIRHL
jgi:hypothetical protein